MSSSEDSIALLTIPLMDPLISTTIASGLVLLFAIALVHKLRDWPRFRDTLLSYQLLPRALVPWAAAGVAVVEAVIVIGGLVPACRAIAALLACGLLLTYAAAMGVNLARGRVFVDCGCGGFGRRQPLAWWMVRRNLLLGTLALVGAWPVAPRPFGAAELFVIACATASALGLYVAHATLAGNGRHISR